MCNSFFKISAQQNTIGNERSALYQIGSFMNKEKMFLVYRTTGI